MIATDGTTTAELELRPGRFIIGRTTDNDLQIDSRFVSRHHCQIVTTRGSCVIEDLNSTNGIYIKSKRVRQHHLNDGDVVQIGKHELLYIDERSPRQPRHDEDHAATATGCAAAFPGAVGFLPYRCAIFGAVGCERSFHSSRESEDSQ